MRGFGFGFRFKGRPGSAGFSGNRLAVVEGADAAAFTGSVIVSGDFAVVEGADLAAFQGEGINTGDFAVVEGADAAAFRGGRGRGVYWN